VGGRGWERGRERGREKESEGLGMCDCV